MAWWVKGKHVLQIFPPLPLGQSLKHVIQTLAEEPWIQCFIFLFLLLLNSFIKQSQLVTISILLKLKSSNLFLSNQSLSKIRRLSRLAEISKLWLCWKLSWRYVCLRLQSWAKWFYHHRSRHSGFFMEMGFVSASSSSQLALIRGLLCPQCGTDGLSEGFWPFSPPCRSRNQESQ